ncbi:hypothetical protein GCM10010486_26480 [Nonomuraea roseoviolacea subsp. carminata]
MDLPSINNVSESDSRRREYRTTREEMATVTRPDENSEARPCRACRGRGFKLKSSRRSLLIDADGEEAEPSEERKCLDCLGDGQGEGSGR